MDISRKLFWAIKTISNTRKFRSSACSCLPRYGQDSFQEIQTLKERRLRDETPRSRDTQVIPANRFKPSTKPWHPEENESPFVLELGGISDVEQLLEFIVPELKNMNDADLMASVLKLSRLQSKERLPLSYFVRNAKFIALLDVLRKTTRSLIGHDLVSVTKMLSLCKVPLGSRVFAAVLNSLKEKLNDLDLFQLTFLRKMLTYLSHEPTKLSDALLVSLPKAISAQVLQNKQYRDSPASLVEALAVLVDNPKMNLDAQNEILRSLLGKVSSLEPWRVRVLTLRLCQLSSRTKEVFPGVDLLADSRTRISSPPTVDPIIELVYNETVDVLTDHIQTYKPDQLLLTTLSMNAMKAGSHFIYHEGFCRALTRRVVEERWSPEETSKISSTLSGLKYVDPSLCQYLNEVLTKTIPSLLEGPDMIYRSVDYFSMCRFRPSNFDAYFDELMDRGGAILDEMRKATLIWLAIDTATLGRISPHLFRRIFSESLFEELELSRKSLPKVKLLHLQLLASAFGKELTLPKIPNVLFKQCVDESRKFYLEKFRNGPKLLGALNYAFGDRCVVDGAYSKEGHMIDYVVVLRDHDLSPVPVNNSDFELSSTMDQESLELTKLEDITVPPGCTRYHIIVFGIECYANNCRRLKGSNVLWKNTVATLDGITVAISKPDWLELPDQQKIPYLVEKVRTAKDDDIDEVIDIKVR